MLKMKSVSSPTLVAGAFTVTFNDGGLIINDPLTPAHAITTNTAATPTVLPMTNTTGFVIGQTVLVADSAGHAETGVISGVTPGVSVTVSAPLVATYTVANGATVTALAYRVSVVMSDPLTAATTFAVNWAVAAATPTVVTVTIDKVTAGAGPALVLANAVTADVAGCVVTVIADIE
jgi:hypothetical protein